MNSLIRQNSMNSVARSAYEQFKREAPPGDHAAFVLAVLFLRYLDAWGKLRSKPDRNRRDSDEREPRFDTHALEENPIFENPSSVDEIGRRLNRIFRELTDANPRKLAGVFEALNFDSEIQFGPFATRQLALKTLVDGFSGLRFKPDDFLPGQSCAGGLFAYFIGILGDADRGPLAYATPENVSALMASLMDVRPGESVMDPCCGTGSLLLHVGARAVDESTRVPVLFGQDRNAHCVSLCRLHMLMNGLDDAIQVECGDSLRDPKFTTMGVLRQFDVVVSAPPFSLSHWGREELEENDKYNRFTRGFPPKGKGDYAFISHMIACARERSGRIAVLTSKGVLFRAASEKVIREQLVKDGLLRAVIVLPPGTLRDTVVATSILVFGKSPGLSDVLFVDMTLVDESAPLGESAISIVAEIFHGKKLGEFPYARFASIEEIGKNDFNLDPVNYLKSEKSSSGDEQEAQLRGEIAGLENKLATIQAKLRSLLE